MTGVRDWSIGQRLFAGFAVVAALLALSAVAVSSWQREGAGAQREFVHRILPASERALDLQRELSQLALAVRAQLLAPDPARGRQVAEAAGQARGALQALRAARTDTQEAAALGPVEAAVARYLEEAGAAAEVKTEEAAEALEAGLASARAEAFTRVQDLIAQQRDEARKAVAAMEESRQSVSRGLLATYAVIVALLLLLGLLIAGSIRTPARRLTQFARSVQQGRWHEALSLGPRAAAARGELLEPRDELARIGLAFGAAAEALERRELRLRVDAAVAQAACSGHDAKAMADAALRSMADALGLPVGVVYAADAQAGRLEPIATRALAQAPAALAFGEGLPGRAALERRALVEQLPEDPALRVRLGVDEVRARAVAAVPAMLGDDVLGVIVVGSLHGFDQAHLELLGSAAVQLALGLNNACSHVQLQQKNEEIQAQSEELQAQSEELQAQSEELQAQNEELQQRSEQLAQADRNKNHFLGLLAHELRNPLGAIANSLFVLERASLDEPAARSLAVIQRQMHYLRRLIDDLLDITRVSHGKLRLKREPLDLVELVRECVQDCRAPASRAGLALQADLPPGPLHASADRTRIAQVVANLLGNAIKFCERGGTVRVRLERMPDGQHARICVVDDGIGIEPEVLARLFQPFSQGGAGHSNGGLGLGLALSKALVELHAGRIEARSAGTGRGSEVEVVLPLSPAPALGSTPARPPTPAVRRRVLVIEDNVDAAETMRMALEIEGHEVDVAADGIVGLDKARTLRPDVVLCDLGIPGIDGYEVARNLRGDPGLEAPSLIALSGYAMEEDRARSRAAGFDAHLAKPVDFRALGELIARLSPASQARAPVG